jgi:hypothetical protein
MAKDAEGALCVNEASRCVLEFRPPLSQNRLESTILEVPHKCENNLVYFSRENFIRGVAAIRMAGIKVMTLEDEIAALRPYSHLPSSTASFSNYLMPENLGFKPESVIWMRYSFASRRLLAARLREEPTRQWSILLRSGQPVAAFDNRRFLGYYSAFEGYIRKCEKPQEMMEECHWQSLPAAMNFEKMEALDPFVALYIPQVWLPPRHYDLLFKRLIGPQGKNDGGFVLIHRLDLPLVESIIGKLGISLVDGPPPQKENTRLLGLADMAATCARQAYAAKLKSEQGTRELERIGQTRHWEIAEPPEFRKLLVDYSNQAYEFDLFSDEILSYLVDRLPRSIDWKYLRDGGSDKQDIQGIIIDADETQSRMRKGQNYYKVIIHELGMSLGILTTRRLPWGEYGTGRPGYFIAANWRATPYAGRIKFTGCRDTVASDWVSGSQAAEVGFSYIYGIPSIERRLASDLYLGAFFLDRDAKYWQGSNELSRYFAGHGKLIEKMVADFDEPASLFEDIFGRYFYLKFGQENFLQHRQFIQATEVGRWERFIAHSGMRSLLALESGLPAFDLCRGSVPRDVGHMEVSEAAILALLKYHGQLEEKKLYDTLAKSKVKQELIPEAISNLVKRRRAFSHDNLVFYDYPFCQQNDRLLISNPETMNKASLDARLFYAGIRPFLPMVHPLGYGVALSNVGPSINNFDNRKKRLMRSDEHSIIIAREKKDSLIAYAIGSIKKFGAATLRSHPWNIEIAVSAIEMVRNALPGYEIKVQRKDTKSNYKGKEVIESWFRIYSPEIIDRLCLADRIMHSGIANKVTVTVD